MAPETRPTSTANTATVESTAERQIHDQPPSRAIIPEYFRTEETEDMIGRIHDHFYCAFPT